MKGFKKLFAVLLALCFVVGLSPKTSAASTIKIVSTDVEFDTPHGHYFYVSGNSNQYLNMYTSGAPVSATKVTTWSKEENEPTQAWDIGYLSNGKFIIVVNNNRSLAIDFDRNYNTPQVQLYSWINDYYDDVVMDKGIYGGNSAEPIKLVNRSSYLNVTNTNTAVYDANGKVCVWNSTPTYWVHIA